MSELPQDPMSPAVANAIALYDTFTGLQTAGFSEGQALYLVGMYLQGVAASHAQAPVNWLWYVPVAVLAVFLLTVIYGFLDGKENP